MSEKKGLYEFIYFYLVDKGIKISKWQEEFSESYLEGNNPNINLINEPQTQKDFILSLIKEFEDA